MTDTTKDERDRAYAAAGTAGRRGQDLLTLIFPLPKPLRLAILLTGLFSLTVLALAYWYGAPLELPKGRMSRILGVNSSLPLLVALLAYLLAQGINWLTGAAPVKPVELLRNSVYDLLFVTLFVIVIYFHFHLKMWIPIINPELYDAEYLAWETQARWLVEVCFAIRGTLAPYMPVVDQWYQMALVLMFVTSFSYFAVSRDRFYPHVVLGVLMVMIIGGLSYLIAPAAGPFLYEKGANAVASDAQISMWWAYQQVQTQGMAWIAENGQHYFTSSLAAMPSLHVAQVVVMTYYILRSRSLLGPVFVALSAWILVESVASRWHYTVDAPFGIALAIAVIWTCNRVCRSPRQVAQPAVAENPATV